MNILIVDDRPSLARVTAVALRTLECHAFVAHSTAAATRVLDTEKIDAVFLDVNLGQENGLDYLSTLVQRTLRTPVVIFTSHAKDDVVDEAMSRGAFDCLIKPYTLDDLREQKNKIEKHWRLVGGENA